jgi:RNA polymerase sigma-70 factor (ECF subfamily)
VTLAPTTSPSSERTLLESARSGDDGAFGEAVEPYVRELRTHCYRLLGSIHDAEDAVQDALLRAWTGLDRFEGPFFKAWLYRITTNVCLNQLDAARVRQSRIKWVEPYPDHWLDHPDDRDAPDVRYESREAIELAFVMALQHLQPRPRAVLVLRDVLGFSARDVAETLATSVAAVNSALQRARATLDKRLPERSQQTTLRLLGNRRLRELVERFVDAFESGDIDAMTALLSEDVVLETRPQLDVYRGGDAIAALMPATPGTWRLLPTRANGQLVLGAYRWDPKAACHRAAVLDVLTVHGDRVVAVMAFWAPDLFPRLGLPAELATSPPLSGRV